MPVFPGLLAMPTVLVNAGLSLVRDRTVTVRGPDRLAVISPMYNEEAGAGRALASLLEQTRAPDEVALSINGGTDRTHGVVTEVLAAHGFERTSEDAPSGLPARLERWRRSAGGPDVWVLVYARQTAKSESVNNLVHSGLLSSDRILLVDGDTVFHPDFVSALADNFYRLRRSSGGRGGYVVEDYALQSGAVMSYLPPDAPWIQRFISAARSAEYAFSGVLRRGQVRQIGDGPVFGASRLFTVVGCGFAARRDVLPVPCDTMTEDHDLTLAAQGRPAEVDRLTPRELERRGFRVVVDGVERSFAEVLDGGDEVELRRGGNARYVGDAVMFTEDPPHLGGYLAQIERWNGGGLQNVLKRIVAGPPRRAMTPNVRYVVASSQIEDILGLLLLVLFPIALGLSLHGRPFRLPVAAVSAWLGFDLLATLVMTLVGFVRFHRGVGRPRREAWGRALGSTLACALPFLSLKYLNPLSYVSAISQVVPPFLRQRAAARRGAGREARGVAWQRPSGRRLERRTAGVAASMLGVCLLVFVGVLQLAPGLESGNAEAWRLIYQSPRLEMADHEELPLMTAVVERVPGPVPAVRRTVAVREPAVAVRVAPAVYPDGDGVAAPVGPLRDAPMGVRVAQPAVPAASAEGDVVLDVAADPAPALAVAHGSGAWDLPALRLDVDLDLAARPALGPRRDAPLPAPVVTAPVIPAPVVTAAVAAPAAVAGPLAAGPVAAGSGTVASAASVASEASVTGVASEAGLEPVDPAVTGADAPSSAPASGTASGPASEHITPLAQAVVRLGRAAARAATEAVAAPSAATVAGRAGGAATVLASEVAALDVSRYCRPAFVARPAGEVRRLEGEASAYRPLSPWELLMLARLAPIEPYVVEAATAYDISPRFLLQVLVNESYLDPLAVGRTGDKGLSQMTSDALTLLGGVSSDAHSPLANTHLLAGDFSVFDPDFSVCAGAAKLAWAARQPGARGEAETYAVYINPVRGLVDGRVSDEHRSAVDAMLALQPLVTRMGEVYAAYAADPSALAPYERELVRVSEALAAGQVDLQEAYRRSLGVVRAAQVDDVALYQTVLDRLFPSPRADAAVAPR